EAEHAFLELTRTLAGDDLDQRCLLGYRLVDHSAKRALDLVAAVVDLMKVELQLHPPILRHSRDRPPPSRGKSPLCVWSRARLSATITVVKWLAALMSGLGLVIGIGLAVARHHDRPGANGWTGYVAVNQTRYADYLPTHHASWLPGLVLYPLIGALVGLAIALLLARLGFRLT